MTFALMAGLMQGTGSAAPPAPPAPPAAAPARAGAAAKALRAPGDLKVTFAARECPEYTDIMANLARNDIQESLRDLGKDTVYTSGQPVDPAIEEPNHPNCDPLVGWKFQWGTGVNGKKDLLSLVSGAGAQTPATKGSTPLLDKNGAPTGRSLAGAVTVTLNDQQRQWLSQGRLWAQGGTVSDPLLNGVFGRGTYGFGALRCAVDNLNGDNVETVAFPSGYTHVFCYYYAVTPPPGAGKIVVRKRVEGGGDQDHTFDFNGNVSYNPGGAFDVTAAPGKPGEVVFNRGETRPQDEPWDFTEEVPPGWKLGSVTCDSANNNSGTTVSGARVEVTLAAGDTVTCTYVDKRVFANGISVYKRTEGGVGGPFAFQTTPIGLTGPGSVTTDDEDDPKLAGVVENAPAGTYTIRETLPAPTRMGRWVPAGVECVDVKQKTSPVRTVVMRTAAVEHTVTLTDKPVNCVFTNRFEPTGELRIEKYTVGGYGRADFQVRSTVPELAASQRERGPIRKSVTTSAGDNPAATALTGLPLGRYFVTELRRSDPNGTWRLTGIVCDGRAIPLGSATAGLNLTASSPNHTCRFTDRFTPRAQLRLEKLIRDPQGVRTGAVAITASCRDGHRTRLTVKPGRSGLVRLGKPLILPTATTCRVQETADGARGPAKVTTRHQVGGGKARSGRTVEVKVGGSRSATVRFTNTYWAALGVSK